eukprot:TRINITY_DN15333_c0_g1_i2.p1 TRINITY_DN15333_c0_g1~~TRINITY_DN15333_c0_g1_i2.p1  ORF type:complete len:743 (-),score=131.52 TRINITY_DN15333_c0_g1_i2:90-2219(-)
MEHEAAVAAAPGTAAPRRRRSRTMQDIIQAFSEELSEYQGFLEARFLLQSSELYRAIAAKHDREVDSGTLTDKAWLSVLQYAGWMADDAKMVAGEAVQSNWDARKLVRADRAARRIQEVWQRRRQQRLEMRLMLRRHFQHEFSSPGAECHVTECALAHVLQQGCLEDLKQARTWSCLWRDIITRDEEVDTRLRDLNSKVDALRGLRNRERLRWTALLASLPTQEKPLAWSSCFETIDFDLLREIFTKDEVHARRCEALLGLQPRAAVPTAPLVPRRGPPRHLPERGTPGLKRLPAEAHHGEKHCVVRVVRRPAGAVVNSDGKRKVDFAGHIGLKVGLGAPSGAGLDWELVVLGVENVQFSSMAKLCRGDSIVRVGRMTELPTMLAFLNTLDRTGGNEVEHLEIEAMPRFGVEGSRFADAALAIHEEDELLQSMDDEVADVHAQLPLQTMVSDAEQAMLALDREIEISAPWSQWLESEPADRKQMTCAARMQKMISTLNSAEALDLLGNLTPSASRSATPAGTTPVPWARSTPSPGPSPFPGEHDYLAVEVEALSQSLMAAATGKGGDARAGEQLWETLLAGIRGDGAVHRSVPGQRPDQQILYGLLWTEALFKISAGALKKRRRELTCLAAQWCIRGVNDDWMKQISRIDETLGWVSQKLDAIEAQLRRMSLGQSGPHLVRQATALEQFPTSADQDSYQLIVVPSGGSR